MVNFAQRIDLLEGLQGGVAGRKLADDWSYWDKAAGRDT